MEIKVFSLLTVCVLFSEEIETPRINKRTGHRLYKNSMFSLFKMTQIIQTWRSIYEKSGKSSSRYLISHHDSSGLAQIDATPVCLRRHVRKKRIIDLSSGPKTPSTIRDVPYMVRIKENEIDVCGGSILSPKYIITSAHCVIHALIYHVISGTSRSSRGVKHDVVEKVIYDEFVPSQYSNDLTLLLITPYVNFRASQNRPIPLFTGHLPPNAQGTISGWGCNTIARDTAPSQLYSIIVPLLNIRICADCYKELATLTEREICTFDPNKEKGCSYGDSGGPLVVDGKLIGVLAFTEESTHPQFPSVFANLMFQPYRDWIFRHVRGDEAETSSERANGKYSKF